MLFLPHLRSGSLAVSRGDSVSAGQVLGQVGNSGMSLLPHLHLEVFEQAEDLLNATTLPFHVARFQRWDGRTWQWRRDDPIAKGEQIRMLP
jgi:murein DD-endopeptidase MepM/ murein hydrolase activator NlpD